MADEQHIWGGESPSATPSETCEERSLFLHRESLGTFSLRRSGFEFLLHTERPYGETSNIPLRLVVKPPSAHPRGIQRDTGWGVDVPVGREDEDGAGGCGSIFFVASVPR